MITIRMIHVKLIMLSGIMHWALTDEISNTVAGSDYQLFLQSLVGNEETIPKQVISKLEDLIAPTLLNSTNEICRNHSEIYIHGLRNYAPWAYYMLDSSAKLQSGILMGNLVSLGNFDECIGVTDVQTDSGPFGGKYCLATMTWTNDTFISMEKLLQITKLPGAPNSVTVKWGFCIPSTCRTEDVVVGLRAILHQDVTVTLSELDCHTNKAKKLKAIDCIAIAIFIAFGVMVILSTSYDLLKKEPRKEILLAFSLYTNGKKLLDTKHAADTLSSLHGIRYLSICWIVLVHKYTLLNDVPSINHFTQLSMTKEWSSMVVVNGVLAVDTFLLLSGLLVAYVWFKRINERQDRCFNVPLYYLHRYIRLTPPLAVMILLQVSLMDHLGSGPMWDSTNSHLIQLCKENWWSALLYIQNYVGGYRMCVGHSWYLSVDMQLFWISPLILLPLLKWKLKWNLLLLGSLVIAGIVTAFTVNYVNEFPAGVSAGVGPKWEAKNRYEYVTTHTRFTPWLVGIGMGYLLHHMRNHKLQLTKVCLTSEDRITSMRQVCAGWLVAVVCFLSVVYGVLPFQQPDYEYNALESSIYNCLHRPIWSFAVAWVIFACVAGYGGPIDKFLSWRAFQPFSRLTYCIYLVHYPFMLYSHFTVRTPVYLNNINKLSFAFSDMGFSILLAALLSLVFESPAVIIEKVLLR